MNVVTRVSVALVVALSALSAAGCAAGAPTASETPSASVAPVLSPEPTPSFVELPDGFPSEQVPLLAGDLLVANELPDGWTVFIDSNDFTNDFAAASELLVAVGYETTVSNSDGDTFFASFSGAEYQVQLSAGVDATYGSSLAYTIYPTE